MLKVVVVDNIERFAQSVAYKLSQEADIEVVGTGYDGGDAVSLVEEQRPDLLLIDLEMQSMHGDEAIRLIRSTNRDVKIMIVSRHADQAHLRSAFEAGANGYVLKGQMLNGRMLDAIVHRVREAMEGRFSIPEAAGTIIYDRFREVEQLKEQLRLRELLSNAEFDVLKHLDSSNPQIAREIGVKPNTVKTQVAGIMKKLETLGIGSRDAAIAYAARAGLIPARSKRTR